MNKGTSVIVFSCFIALIQAQDAIWELPKCRACDRATSFEQCNSFVICNKGEACYVDELITVTGMTVYKAGCRDKAVCLAKHKRKRDDLVACSKCCSGRDLCNEHLCGLQKESNLTLCNSCDGKDGRPQAQQYPEDCSFIRACDPTEACFSSTYMKDETSLRHYSTCLSMKTCSHLTRNIIETYNPQDSVGRRASESICAICCGDELCNQYACETSKKRLRYLYAQGSFDLNTLKEKASTFGRK